MDKLTDFVFKVQRKKWLKKIRKRIKNTDFTIISNNCTAGFIYHDLGLKFNTPTINLFFKTEQYISFIRDLKYYLNCPLIKVNKKNVSYPVGMLKSNNKNKENIYIYFNHYDSFSKAKEKWNERKKRINFDNICFILDFYDSVYDIKLIDKFNKLNIENKIIFTHNKTINKKNSFYFQYKEDITPNGKLFKYNGLSGKRYLDEFDYVDFLNNIK